MRSIDTLVVGGGQAGLACSFHLAQRGVDRVVLTVAVDAGRVVDRLLDADPGAAR